VIGGFDGVGRVEAYDIPANEWNTVANLPRPRNHLGAAAIGDFVYSVGGFVGNGFTPADEVYRFDPERNTWREVAPLPSRRGALAVAVVNGQLHAVGGDGFESAEDNTRSNVARHDVYDPDTDEWTQLPPLPSARNHLAAAGFDGRLYVVGGRFDGGGSTNSAALERYDPSTREWATLRPMPTARSGLAAAVLNGRLVVVGGEVNPNDPDGVFPQVEVYDFATDTWESLDPMAVPRHGIGAAAVGELFYVAGGATRAGFGATDHHDALRIFW
jgi:N-acetylneuraminic acid mutarotase